MGDEILSRIYYNPSNKASLGSVRNLYKEAKADPLWKGTLKDVKNFLASQPTYTRHRDRLLKFKRRRFITLGIGYCYQADLADVSSLSRQNDGVKFLLCVIDTFSKFSWVRPLKTKGSLDTVAAFRSILQESDRIPITLFTDKGTEFVNRDIKELTDSYGIVFYQAQDPSTKASIAERFIRTIKGRIYKYMFANGTSRYIDVLQSLVDGYNNRVHRAIGVAPSQVNKDNEEAIFKRLFPDFGKKTVVQPKFKIGSQVRVALDSGPFRKGFKPRFSEEVYVVTKIVKSDPVTVYKLKSLVDGEDVLGTWYQEELVLTLPLKQDI